MKSYQRLVSVGLPLLALGCGASESSKQSGYASSKDDRWRSRSISV
ncbi:MAG: hypothetical protein M3Q07_10125 [Pseudobdellovibrionaceae bacterium]|nr:hypothetical protein [Pseudobdellovibrionaceae bacterium]